MFQLSTIMPGRQIYNSSRFLRGSTLILWVLLPVIVILYYDIYRHYWLLELTGGRTIRLGVFILPVLYVAAIYHLMNGKCCRARNDIITVINVMLLLYLIFSGVSIVANHNNLSNVRIYSFYTAYPILLFFSIQAVYRRIEHITVTMRVIFLFGVLFSIYSIYFLLTSDVTSMKPIETVIGEIRADAVGGFEGAGGIAVNRLGIPGSNATTYGSLLVLVILTGLWFYKTSHGLVKGMFFAATLFLVGCLVFSFARGAMVSLITAVLYLAWKRFFTMRDFAVVVTVFTVSLVVLIGVSGYDKI